MAMKEGTVEFLTAQVKLLQKQWEFTLGRKNHYEDKVKELLKENQMLRDMLEEGE